MLKILTALVSFELVLVVLTQDDRLFSRMAQEGVKMNFYNFRPKSDFSDGPRPPPLDLMGPSGGQFQFENRRLPFSGEISSGSPLERPDPPPYDPPPYEPNWVNDNGVAEGSYELHQSERRDSLSRWADPEESADQMERFVPDFRTQMKPKSSSGTGRWDRRGLPMDVSWNQHNVHGVAARDGGRFGHKVTKMWHVMPQGGYVMTEQRKPEPGDLDYFQEEPDIPMAQRRRPQIAVKRIRKNFDGDRKTTMLEMDPDSMENVLRQRIRKLQSMMSVLQSRKSRTKFRTR